jgi:DNA-binding IclR family transcriptional regulator
MAFWQKKEVDFSEMATALGNQPGLSAAELARLFDVDRSTITRRLPSMDEAGYLLYEDDDGRLYPFDPDEL